MPKHGETLVGLRRGVDVIEALAGAPDGLLFGELKARLAPLAPSTLSRLLKALQEEGLAENDPATRRYIIGTRARRLGDLLATQLSPAQRVAGVVERLARATGRSAAFCELRGSAVLLAKKHDMPEAFHYAPEGNRIRNLAHHAFAKACLAYAPPGEAQTMREELLQATDATPGRQPIPLDRPWPDFEAELETIRRDRVCVHREDDQPGLKRIVAPVLTGTDEGFAGAIGISFYQPFDGPAEKRLVDAVRHAAEEAAARLEA